MKDGYGRKKLYDPEKVLARLIERVAPSVGIQVKPCRAHPGRPYLVETPVPARFSTSGVVDLLKLRYSISVVTSGRYVSARARPSNPVDSLVQVKTGESIEQATCRAILEGVCMLTQALRPNDYNPGDM